MKRVVIPSFFASLVFGFICFIVACSALQMPSTNGEPPERQVVVDQIYVAPETPAINTTIPVKGEDGEDTGRKYVIVPESQVLSPDAPRVAIDEDVADNQPAWLMFLQNLRTGNPIADFMIPIISAFLLKALAAKRPRQATAAALKSVVSLDPKAAVVNLLKADGWMHTNPNNTEYPPHEQTA